MLNPASFQADVETWNGAALPYGIEMSFELAGARN
jgi:hypothetical protein